MKNNLVGALLVGILFLCTAFTLWTSIRYYFSMREAQRLQFRAIVINNTRNAAQALAAEAVEYSKRNPTMDTVLQQFDIKARSTNAVTPAALAPK